MPQIIVTADNTTDGDEHAVMFTERVSVLDFESPHFQTQLVERLGWAVGDAQDAEQAHLSGTPEAELSGAPEAEETDRRDRRPQRSGGGVPQREASVVTTAS